ncbi:uncharacterized protein LOC128559503 [Mercenaria mercenaria]|uniref:uncharacterized protein LOC128559503 n=1 Tax=Mercenaria mercenaria TaxID=6596 RepID=UPI00234F864F|nr:uncharacterized protein LOC128559503 [Mercenaria mercenaria]
MPPRKRARTSQRAPHTSSSDGNKGPSDQATPKSGQPKSQQTPPSPPNRKRQQTQPAPPNRSEGHVDSPGQSVKLTNVWIIGSSLIKGAYHRLAFRPDGNSLGLQHYNVRITWEFLSGMRIRDIRRSVQYLLQFKDEPDIIVIHCGGNDIGTKSTWDITFEFKMLITDFLQPLLPHTGLIWSQILPRRTWRYVPYTPTAENIRKRINSSLATFVIRNGGGYIKYADISLEKQFFHTDDTHLSELGYDIMLNTLSSALYKIIIEGERVYACT